MTLADYNALKSGLEQIADLGAQIHTNEERIFHFTELIKGKTQEIREIESAISSREKRVEAKRTYDMSRLKTAFKEKFPGESSDEANVNRMIKSAEHEKSKQMKPKPEPPGEKLEISLQWIIGIIMLSPFVFPDVFFSYPVFECTDGEEVGMVVVRDGTENCLDGSDETDVSFEQISNQELMEVRDTLFVPGEIGWLSVAFLGVCVLIVRVWDWIEDEEERRTYTITGLIYERKVSGFEHHKKILENEYRKEGETALKLGKLYRSIRDIEAGIEDQRNKLAALLIEIEEHNSELQNLEARGGELNRLLSDTSRSISHLVPSE